MLPNSSNLTWPLPALVGSKSCQQRQAACGASRKFSASGSKSMPLPLATDTNPFEQTTAVPVTPPAYGNGLPSVTEISESSVNARLVAAPVGGTYAETPSVTT